MANSPENCRFHELAALIDSGECRPYSGALKVGDLVPPISQSWCWMKITSRWQGNVSLNVVKDGVVVDYLTASRVVARLKQILEQKQGCTLERAAIAVPPGISEGNTK